MALCRPGTTSAHVPGQPPRPGDDRCPCAPAREAPGFQQPCSLEPSHPSAPQPSYIKSYCEKIKRCRCGAPAGGTGYPAGQGAGLRRAGSLRRAPPLLCAGFSSAHGSRGELPCKRASSAVQGRTCVQPSPPAPGGSGRPPGAEPPALMHPQLLRPPWPHLLPPGMERNSSPGAQKAFRINNE